MPAARFGYDVRHVPLCLPPGYRLSSFLIGACAPRSTTIILYSLLLILQFVRYTSEQKEQKLMGMTMTQKILAAHCGEASVTAGQLINAKLDIVLGNDITTPVAK